MEENEKEGSKRTVIDCVCAKYSDRFGLALLIGLSTVEHLVPCCGGIDRLLL